MGKKVVAKQKVKESASEAKPASSLWSTFATGVVAAVVVAGVAYSFDTSSMSSTVPKSQPAEATQAAPTEDRPLSVLSGYVPEYRLNHVETHIAKIAPHVTELILFSVHPASDGSISHEPGIAREQLRFARTAKTHGVQSVLLSVGGGGRSAHFERVAKKKELRARLVSELKAVCTEHALDGIDVDWEVPQTPAQKQLLTLLLKDLSAVLRPAGLRLTVALHYWDAPEGDAIQYVDRINYMTYDFTQQPGGHASFKASKRAVEALLAKGVPAEKVALGVPAYARSQTDVRTLSELHDATALAEDANKYKGFLFNGRNQCRKKVRWAHEKRLAGIFVWELGQDSVDETKSLTAAMHDEMRQL